MDSALGPDDYINGLTPIDLDAPTGEAKAKPNDFTFNTISTEEIMATEYPPIMWVVPDYVPEGFSVLAGRQKLGKTWLALDLAVAVATGGAALGQISCEAGDVLYLDMENGPRRIQSRMQTFYPDERNRPDLSRLQFATEAPSLDKGFIPACDKWRRSVAKPRLIVIDVLQRVKPTGSKARNAYENDYAAFQELQTWATENHIGVLALHHTKKGGADDPLEALSGSNGLSACADTTLVLDRDGNGTTLYARGRDVQEVDTAVQFNDGLWSILGQANEVRRSDERNKVLAVLRDQTEPMTPSEVTAETGMKLPNVKMLLSRMAKAGEVTKRGRGSYLHPENVDKFPEKPANTGVSEVTDPETVTLGYHGYPVTFEDDPPSDGAKGNKVTKVTTPCSKMKE